MAVCVVLLTVTATAMQCVGPARYVDGEEVFALDPEVGCAESYDRGDHVDGSVLELRCTNGEIANITFASLGRPSGRCGSFAFPNDDELCESVDIRDIVHEKCSGKTSCTLRFPELLLLSNQAEETLCRGELRRAAVEFRCTKVGHKQIAWFDEERTLAQIKLDKQVARDSKGYVHKEPVPQAVGIGHRSTTCGWGYEVDFVRLDCRRYDRPAAKQAAEDATVVIGHIAHARYGHAVTSCDEDSGVRWNMDEFPDVEECGTNITAYVAEQCLGRPWCNVYVPPRDAGDPCPGRKKTALVVARCDDLSVTPAPPKGAKTAAKRG